MTKQIFIDSLRRSLSGSLDYTVVNEHVQYYSDYIDAQIRQGKSEGQVMEELGDPRLIAKTLLGMGNAQTVTEEYVEETKSTEKDYKHFNINGKNIRIPSWLLTILVCMVVFCILTLIFTITSALLPYILPIIGISILYRFIKNLFR